jgi:hypothetical protein
MAIWVIGLFVSILFPRLFFFFLAGGVLVFFLSLLPDSALYNNPPQWWIGNCPYCEHEVEGAEPVFSCLPCKSKITVLNSEFHRLKTGG